jgi:hypothetical protein
MQNADFCEDVKVGKFVGHLISAVRVALWCFGDKLASCVFVKVVEAGMG